MRAKENIIEVRGKREEEGQKRRLKGNERGRMVRKCNLSM